MTLAIKEKDQALINSSNYISRDLSWIRFNYRVLDQARDSDRSITERLKFMAITSSNLDEFFMIRVGSLYNYLDYQKTRLDYSGLREQDFRRVLLEELQEFVRKQYRLFTKELYPKFEENGFQIAQVEQLTAAEQLKVDGYFQKMLFPMLTPMMYDNFRPFPNLVNQVLVFAVVTKDVSEDSKTKKKLSFVQIPANIPRFFTLDQEDQQIFVPVEDIIKTHLHQLFRNIPIISADLVRITRNGDFTLDESEDTEDYFIEELKQKLKSRRTNRVVRLELSSDASEWMVKTLQEKLSIDRYNTFVTPLMMDLTGLWQIVNRPQLEHMRPPSPATVSPIFFQRNTDDNIFQQIRKQDILLHHPYNSPEHLLHVLESAADDPNVLAIKLTIYRLAKNSRVTSALLKAAERGKHISVLFEIKARFDEENNIREAQRLQQAGCFVIHGIGLLKTHTKIMLIVRKEGNRVTRYVHMSSGNYNEVTSRLYTDVGLLTARSAYGEDVSEFFNTITGHSVPKNYKVLVTAPQGMRERLIELIETEAENARQGLPTGIVVKINSLQDDRFIDALYAASQAGVTVELIVRGICCLRPGRLGLSENIRVRSIVGDYLEHSRLFYFHNNGDPVVLGGSADVMVRSFDRRIESLFRILDPNCRQQAINIMAYNLKDNCNAYQMNEDGSYDKVHVQGEPEISLHRAFFEVGAEEVAAAQLVPEVKIKYPESVLAELERQQAEKEN